MEACDLFRRWAPASLFPFFLLLIDILLKMQLLLVHVTGDWTGRYLCQIAVADARTTAVHWYGVPWICTSIFVQSCHLLFSDQFKHKTRPLHVTWVNIIIPILTITSTIIIVIPIWSELVGLARGCSDVVALVGKHPLSAQTPKLYGSPLKWAILSFCHILGVHNINLDEIFLKGASINPLNPSFILDQLHPHQWHDSDGLTLTDVKCK